MTRRLLPVLLVSATSLTLPAAQDVSLEYRVKAGFLYNFVRYIEWPEPVSGSFLICVAGQNPFGTVLEDLIRNERVRGVPLRTETIPGPMTGCQVVFTPKTSRVPVYLRAAAGTSTLTVGESEGFIEQGGLINFFVEQGRVRFEVNRAAAERVKLRISSRLLQLARIVEPGMEER